MDYMPKVKRSKKSNKSKETYERNGGFSQKHIRSRIAEAEARLTNQSKKDYFFSCSAVYDTIFNLKKN